MRSREVCTRHWVAVAALCAGPLALGCSGGEESGHEVAQTREVPLASLNRAPEIAAVHFEPEAPAPGSSVSVQVEASDPEGDDLALRYEWQVDGIRGEAQGDTYVIHSGARGARIAVRVTATDGSLATTREVWASLRNQPPVIQALVIEPLDQVRDGRDVTASPRAMDPDGDPLSFDFTWSVNGSVVDASGSVLSHEHFERGDEVHVRVSAVDPEGLSSELEGGPIRVENAAPRITSRPGPIGEDGIFRYAIEASDPDGDARFRYRVLAGPDGLTIDSAEGAVVWRPREAQAGHHEVVIEIADPKGGTAEQRFVVALAFELEALPAAPVPE